MPIEFTEPVVWSITLFIFAVGMVGTILPVLPGILIILAGCIWQGCMGEQSIAWWGWTVLGILVVAGLITDKIAGAMGAKKFGSSKAGVWGALIGAIVGIPFSPLVALFVTPFLGAVIAELIFARQDIKASLKAGGGATLGMLVGILMEVTCGLALIAWFCACYFCF